MTTAFDILNDEHQNILRVVEALSSECDKMENGNKMDKEFLTKVISFVREYADKFHHAKEEDILFVELVKDDVLMLSNPTEQMIEEHKMGRDFIKLLEQGLKEGSKAKVIENGREYAHLLQEHIYKEENILYPLADDTLSQEDKEDILEKFLEIERASMKEQEEYLDFAANLEPRI